MLATFNALLDQPILLFVILAFGAAIGIGVEKFFASLDREKRRAYWRGRNARQARTTAKTPRNPVANQQSEPGPVAYAADQLRLVMEAKFERRPLLNNKERRLLACLDKVLDDETSGWRAMGQVSLGEILSSPSQEAYFAVNSKRVDLLIVDGECRPLFAIEYQGTGHHLGQNAVARDAVKMEALRKAGIGYETIKPGDTPAELRALVRKIAGRKAA
jgi:hypothetical protein